MAFTVGVQRYSTRLRGDQRPNRVRPRSSEVKQGVDATQHNLQALKVKQKRPHRGRPCTQCPRRRSQQFGNPRERHLNENYRKIPEIRTMAFTVGVQRYSASLRGDQRSNRVRPRSSEVINQGVDAPRRKLQAVKMKHTCIHTYLHIRAEYFVKTHILLIKVALGAPI